MTTSLDTEETHDLCSRGPVTGRRQDARAVGAGLTQTTRQIRAAAERRSGQRRRQDALLQQRLAGRQALPHPPADSWEPAGRGGAAAESA